jgi:hypothetical protein
VGEAGAAKKRDEAMAADKKESFWLMHTMAYHGIPWHTMAYHGIPCVVLLINVSYSVYPGRVVLHIINSIGSV